MNSKRNLAVIAILILAVALAGCGAKYTKGENMAYQSLASVMGLAALETAVEAYYNAAPDIKHKIWIYDNLFPAIDAAADAIVVYLNAADAAMKHEDLGGKVEDAEFLLARAQEAVLLAQNLWQKFNEEVR